VINNTNVVKKYMTKCRKCGCDDFDINEFIVHRASLCKKDSVLTAYKVKNHGIDIIVCNKCKEEYYEGSFKQINF